jgi:hypothetical protein
MASSEPRSEPSRAPHPTPVNNHAVPENPAGSISAWNDTIDANDFGTTSALPGE